MINKATAIASQGAKRIQYVALCICSCLSLPCNVVATDTADDWDLFANDRQHQVGLRFGNSDSISWGVDARLMLPGRTEIALDYLQSEFDLIDSEENLANYSALFTTDPLARWSAQLTYERSGKTSSLLTQDIGLGVQYSRDRWLMGVRYLVGEVRLQTNPLVQSIPARRYNLDREAIEVQLASFGDRWQGSVRFLDYQYERSVRLNPNSLILLRRLGLNTFQQVFGILDWSASAELVYQQQKHGFRVGYSQHRLELTNESGKIPYLGWEYQLTSDLTAGLLGAVGLADSEHYGELALSYQF